MRVITVILLIIALIIGIVFLAFQYFGLTDNKKSNERKINELKNRIKELEEEQGESSSNSSIEIGYDYIVTILEGKPYIIPINRAGLEDETSFYYNKFEVKDINNNVKKALLFQLGLDPASTIYFIMEDGSVRKVLFEGSMPNVVYSTEEVVSSDKEVIDIKLEGKDLNAICKDDSKIKIDESLN